MPFILGLITSFSLPPYNFVIINFIAFPTLLIFFLNHYQNRKLIAFKIGWFFGFGYFISSIYWITHSLTFDNTFKILIPFALILIPAFLAIFYGLITFFCAFFNLKKNISTILIFIIIFSVIEFFRGYIIGGFPWNLIVYSWTNYISFLQILPLIGTYAFNLLSLTFFLIPTILFFSINKKIKIFVILSTIFLMLINYIYGSNIINNYGKISEKSLGFTIKIISPKINISRFYEVNNPEEILKELIQLSSPVDSENTIFIFPEGMLTNIYLEDLDIYTKLFKENFSEKHKIVLGINSNENSKIYNTMVVLNNEAKVLAKYKKNKLVPFGEFLPFEDIFFKFGLKKITQGYQSFSSDNNRQVFNINNINFLPLICYEIIYSGKLNNNKQNFLFILNISEDGWFGSSVGINQHFSHSIFRAIEEGKNLIRSSNNGISAHINPKGQIINGLESTSKGVIKIKSFKEVKKTLFNEHGNKLFLYFLVIYIILFFFQKKREIQ